MNIKILNMEFNLKIIKSIDTSKYEVLISVSLFKLNIYGSSYRNFSKYCKDFMNWLPLISKSFYVRAYIDESVLTDESFLKIWDKNYKNLEIVLYEFKDFKITQSDKENPIFKDVAIFEGTHDGTFGAITRFLPFYNLPEVPKNIKWLWISDIDLPSYIFSYENIKDLKNNKAKVSFFSAACNNREWFPDTVRYPISAGKTIVSTDTKFNISDLEIFLSDVLKGKYDDIKNNIMEKRAKVQYHYAPAKHFTYGFDELYVNLYLHKVLTSVKYIVYYEISLDSFKRKVNLPYIKEYEKLRDLIWRDPKMNTKQNKLKLLKYTDEMYKEIKKLDLEDYRLKICVKDYKKYHKKIDLNLNTNWGLSTMIIVD